MTIRKRLRRLSIMKFNEKLLSITNSLALIDPNSFCQGKNELTANAFCAN